ncbi:LysR family transcriptional regulator [Pararobbsia silviterrae]|uniref:LysR family transcriptional regulator n=1 Tax=Pararobbsia silviterrae TaxID=1792498 RepID=A0A494XZA7_9BURK|nr:LysR family transcriptional regulator [Pararobbsia silviterrae]RKP55862.1 LysR family transcriptional regulator [Pararobbsia silviterrae]
MNQLQAMRVFLKVVELKSFSLAGEQLGISRPAVTRSIAMLEEHFNVRLLHRSTHNVSVTEAGEAYVEGVRDVLEKLDEVEAEVNRTVREPKGTLRLAAPTSFPLADLAPMLADYRRRYPEVRLEVALADSHIDMVEGRFDACFVADPRVASATLVSRALLPITPILVASPGYLARAGVPDHVAALAHHELLAIAETGRQTLTVATASGTERIDFEPALAAPNSMLVREAALADMGIAAVPEDLVRDDLAQGRLERVLPGCTVQSPEQQMSILYSGRRHLSAKVRSFIEFAVAYFRERHEQAARGAPFLAEPA